MNPVRKCLLVCKKKEEAIELEKPKKLPKKCDCDTQKVSRRDEISRVQWIRYRPGWALCAGTQFLGANSKQKDIWKPIHSSLSSPSVCLSLLASLVSLSGAHFLSQFGCSMKALGTWMRVWREHLWIAWKDCHPIFLSFWGPLFPSASLVSETPISRGGAHCLKTLITSTWRRGRRSSTARERNTKKIGAADGKIERVGKWTQRQRDRHTKAIPNLFQDKNLDDRSEATKKKKNKLSKHGNWTTRKKWAEKRAPKAFGDEKLFNRLLCSSPGSGQVHPLYVAHCVWCHLCHAQFRHIWHSRAESCFLICCYRRLEFKY